ncbi:MAG: ribosomal-protein-alanine N-acetyltransferase [Calditrichaeota bacterium]|nr:MAG: ribosomal-protein-alanine N-acetyltransferase [Calditrichota bacterium]
MADEVHIINLAVHPAFQRRGLATRLMMEVMSTARKRKAGRVFLEVRRSNDKAIGLYKKLGFRITGYRPNYYQDSNEDAILMEKILI